MTEGYTTAMPEPKTLLTFSPEMNIAVRHACKLDAMRLGKTSQPLGPYIEALLARSMTVQRAARAAGVRLPKRIADARGKYERK